MRLLQDALALRRRRGVARRPARRRCASCRASSRTASPCTAGPLLREQRRVDRAAPRRCSSDRPRLLARRLAGSIVRHSVRRPSIAARSAIAAEVVVLPTPPEPETHHHAVRRDDLGQAPCAAVWTGRSGLSRVEWKASRRVEPTIGLRRFWTRPSRVECTLQDTAAYIGAPHDGPTALRRSDSSNTALRYQLENTLRRGRMAALALTDRAGLLLAWAGEEPLCHGARRGRADRRARLAARPRRAPASAKTTSRCARSNASASSSTSPRSAAASRATRCSRTRRAASTAS